MVIGINKVLPQPATQDLRGPVGDDFIRIHIMAGTGAGLEGIDDKLVIPFAINNFLGGFHYGSRAFSV